MPKKKIYQVKGDKIVVTEPDGRQHTLPRSSFPSIRGDERYEPKGGTEYSRQPMTENESRLYRWGAALQGIPGVGVGMQALARARQDERSVDRGTGTEQQSARATTEGRPEFEDPYIDARGEEYRRRRAAIAGRPISAPRAALDDREKRIGTTYDVQAAAAARARDEKSAIRGDEQDFYGQQAEEAQDRAGEYRDEVEDARAHQQRQLGMLRDAQAKAQELLDRGINPNRIFTDGTVSKTKAILNSAASGGLAALGAQRGWGNGRNKTMELLNKMVERDVRSQEIALDKGLLQQDSLFRQYANAFDDRDQAKAAYEAALKEYQINEAKKLSSRLGDAQAKEKVNDFIVQLEREKESLARQFMQRAEQERAQSIAAQAAAKQQQLQALDDQYGGPGGYEKLDPADTNSRLRLKDMRKAVGDVGTVKRKIDNLKWLIKKSKEKYGDVVGVGPHGNLPGMEAGTQALTALGSERAELAGRIRSAINDIFLGTTQQTMQGILSDQDLKRMERAGPVQNIADKQLMHRLNIAEEGIQNAQRRIFRSDEEAYHQIMGEVPGQELKTKRPE